MSKFIQNLVKPKWTKAHFGVVPPYYKSRIAWIDIWKDHARGINSIQLYIYTNSCKFNWSRKTFERPKDYQHSASCTCSFASHNVSFNPCFPTWSFVNYMHMLLHPYNFCAKLIDPLTQTLPGCVCLNVASKIPLSKVAYPNFK
jgi:hypothetical protein